MHEIIEVFDSRLKTLSQLVDRAFEHFGDDDFLSLRLVNDMLPLGTQIAFTCNQPHNFAQWVHGEDVVNLDRDVTSVLDAKQLIAATRSRLATAGDLGTKLPGGKRLDFGPRYAELSGVEYMRDFLIPNFYFHLVTTYAILRVNGLAIGKADYMAHLLDRVKEQTVA